MAAWDFTFPTIVERTLWRIAVILCLGYGFLGSALGWCSHNRSIVAGWYHAIAQCLSHKKREDTHATRKKDNCRTPDCSKLATWFHHINQWFDWMRNLSPDHDPMLAIPVRIWLPTTVLCIIYCFSRAYILIEDVIALRSLPKSAFQMIDWGRTHQFSRKNS
jgi:hypothetical protein